MIMEQVIFFILFVNIVWFETEAFVEYIRLFDFNLFKVKDYSVAKQNNFELTYHSYLLQKHNNFLTRLITCPICFTTWLSLILGLCFLENKWDFTIVFASSLILYHIYRKVSLW